MLALPTGGSLLCSESHWCLYLRPQTSIAQFGNSIGILPRLFLEKLPRNMKLSNTATWKACETGKTPCIIVFQFCASMFQTARRGLRVQAALQVFQLLVQVLHLPVDGGGDLPEGRFQVPRRSTESVYATLFDTVQSAEDTFRHYIEGEGTLSSQNVNSKTLTLNNLNLHVCCTS